MKTHSTSLSEDTDVNQDALRNTDFSLILGGPLFQLLRRTRLSDDAVGMMRRRIISITLFAWFPLLVFSLLEHLALGLKVDVPFLADVEVQVRFLIALPLLIYAELVVHQRMRTVVRTFIDRGLIQGSSLGKLQSILNSTFKLRNSIAAELLLLAFVYGVGVLIVWRQVAMEGATWYAISNGRDFKLSLTGMWYGYVSLPLFQFILIRWYFRIFIWVVMLWRIARLELNLIPTHPDRAGGLGFLNNVVYAFGPLLLAHGVLFSGMIANRIFYLGAKLPEFKLEILSLVIVLLVFVLGPLCVFLPELLRVKRVGMGEYGMLAVKYARQFDRKWIRGERSEEEQLLGSADIQSLADLQNSFEVIKEMRMVPFNKEMILQLAIIALIPFVPLTLTMFSLEQLLDRFIGTVF